MSEEKQNIVPDFDFEVDSPVLEESDDTNVVEEEVSPVESDIDIETPFEEEPTTDAPDDDTDKEWGDKADPNIVAAYQFYRDNGIISNDYEDFDGTPESLQAVMRAEDENKYNQVYDYLTQQAPEFARPLLELVLNKGNELTLEEASEIFEITKPSEISTEDLDDEVKATEFLVKHYMDTYEDTAEEAAERIDILKDRNKLTKEAKIIFEKDQSVKQQLLQAKVDQAKEENQQRQINAQKFEESFLGSIKESKWRDDLKKEVAQEFYGGVFKKKMDHIMKNPTALSQLVHFMKYYDGKQFNLSEFEKVVESRVNNKRKNNIQNYWSSNVGGGRVTDKPRSSGVDLTNYEIEL